MTTFIIIISFVEILHTLCLNTYIPFTLHPRRGSVGTSDIPPRHILPTLLRYELIAKYTYTTDVTGGKHIAL
jgi:hypothetical protein